MYGSSSMSTLRWRRWKTGVIVVAFAYLPILWLFWRVAGRSLSLVEILGAMGGVATIVAAFTWAFDTRPTEETTPDTPGAIDPIFWAKSPSDVATVVTPQGVVASEPG